MSEREIKVGSVWKNVHGEVTVTQPDGLYVFTSALPDKCVSHEYFRLTHAWVSDPVEAPKVGTWWRYKGCSTTLLEVRYVDHERDRVEFYGLPPVHFLTFSELHGGYEPCDPPALHAAINKLVTHYGDTWGTKEHPWPPLDAMKDFIDAAREVARLYQEGER